MVSDWSVSSRLVLLFLEALVVENICHGLPRNLWEISFATLKKGIATGILDEFLFLLKTRCCFLRREALLDLVKGLGDVAFVCVPQWSLFSYQTATIEF